MELADTESGTRGIPDYCPANLSGMTGTTTVFAGQLIGLPVLGPDAESIGKVKDVLAGLRVNGQPPRVLGLVVEMATRQKIFVPILRVASIDPGAVTLSTGSVSLRHFHLRDNEVLIIDHLLSTRVSVKSSGTKAIVVDVAMERMQTRDWDVTTVAIRERSGRFGRRSPITVLQWEDVNGLDSAETSSALQSTQQLIATFDSMHATDVAHALHDLPDERRYEVADALDNERLADVLEELSEHDQKNILGQLDEDRAADVLEAMNPDDAADLLAELPETTKDRLLELMEPAESAPVQRLLAYSSDTAGGLMTPEPIILPPEATIAEALARVRNAELPPALASMVFVCQPPTATPTGRYLGCVHLQRLLSEPPGELVSNALDVDLPILAADKPLIEVTKYFAAYNLVCAPVVDDQAHLLGAVTVDDVLDHLLPSDWRENLPHPERKNLGLDDKESHNA